MVKRLVNDRSGSLVLDLAGLKDAPVLDLMCSHFVLTLAARQGSQASMCAATSTACCRWPAATWCGRTHAAPPARIPGAALPATTTGAGHEAWATREFLARYGTWRGPYEEGTLFFYLDEYAKDQPKDLIWPADQSPATG
jgi:hypothetical protein